eukprot:CAMPEP_0176103318 /NCGR_PEP_ID=MMETSP0120_2-20121206/51834_1 /TAXON_ID=160619 /ORGANISM="Kryptoperidinium foliaceum, Strain CCMP 1326" /LENGTH=79 /DNA_ID=CAMNT_0017437401 /DNA_START=61 /DNA_END=300 /DNA_ORIENTATION=+
MGGSSSKPTDPVPECIDCLPDKKQPLPPRDKITSDGGPCAPFYEFVDSCMNINNGQITKCKEEWEAFKKCYDQHKPDRK